MSELKTRTAYSIAMEEKDLESSGTTLVYLKSEADKVIADKDKEIAELKEQVHDYGQGLYVMQARAEKEARHHKYKRCMDKAEWCESKVYHIRRTPLCDMSEHEYWQYENDFWQRWQNRWLELAEKFKEGV